LKEHAFRRVASGSLGPDDQINVTVEHLQQGEQLIWFRRIEEKAI